MPARTVTSDALPIYPLTAHTALPQLNRAVAPAANGV